MNVVLWIIAGVLAAAFLGAGLTKLLQPKEKLTTTMGWVEDFSPGAIKLIGALEVLAADIADHRDNQTRFVVVAREGVPARTGHDKTTIVCFQHTDRPGSLLVILQEFAARGINLTKLESRPTKRALGDYCFIIDLEGHVEDEVVADSLRTLKAELADVKFLGSYPAGGDHGPSVRRSADAAWRAADEWLQRVRSGRVAAP